MEFHNNHPGSFMCPEYSSNAWDRNFYVPISRTMITTMDINNEKMNDVGASSGNGIRVFRLRGETCKRSITAAPSERKEKDREKDRKIGRERRDMQTQDC